MNEFITNDQFVFNGQNTFQLTYESILLDAVFVNGLRQAGSITSIFVNGRTATITDLVVGDRVVVSYWYIIED